MDYSAFDAFLQRLQGAQRVIVQAHDFPSHDALAAAFAMAYLLKQKGFKPFISYKGYISRVTLRNMVEWLRIPTVSPDRLGLMPSDKIIVVGGCIGQKNVVDLPGLEVAVIDHHDVVAPSFVWYRDIRPSYGATSAMMVEYFNHLGIELVPRVASALLVGLTFDTAHFTKRVSEADCKALLQLQAKADMPLVNRICRNNIEEQDLQYFNVMLDSLVQEKNCAFAVLPDGCSATLLGVLGDFLLSVDTIDIAILSARSGDKTYLSLRSECAQNDVSKIVMRALNDPGVGFGGGHAHAAGGIINQRYQLCSEPDHVYQLLRPQLQLT